MDSPLMDSKWQVETIKQSTFPQDRQNMDTAPLIFMFHQTNA